MSSPELLTPMLIEEHNQRVAAAQRLHALRPPRPAAHPLARRMARPLARALLRAGARLLRYSAPEAALGAEI